VIDGALPRADGGENDGKTNVAHVGGCSEKGCGTRLLGAKDDPETAQEPLEKINELIG
jgi:hypothetical protein